MNEEESKNANELLSRLLECEEMCEMSISYSLHQRGDFAKQDHIKWLQDCTDVCNLSKKYFIRDSEYVGDTLNLCSYICDDCAESCETFFEDQQMVDCGKICRECANACRSAIEEQMDEDIEEEELGDKE